MCMPYNRAWASRPAEFHTDTVDRTAKKGNGEGGIVAIASPLEKMCSNRMRKDAQPHEPEKRYCGSVIAPKPEGISEVTRRCVCRI